MIFTRPITDEQKQKLIENQKPSQDDINAAASDLIWNLMQRVDELEKERDNP